MVTIRKVVRGSFSDSGILDYDAGTLLSLVALAHILWIVKNFYEGMVFLLTDVFVGFELTTTNLVSTFRSSD